MLNKTTTDDDVACNKDVSFSDNGHDNLMDGNDLLTEFSNFMGDSFTGGQDNSNVEVQQPSPHKLEQEHQQVLGSDKNKISKPRPKPVPEILIDNVGGTIVDNGGLDCYSNEHGTSAVFSSFFPQITKVRNDDYPWKYRIFIPSGMSMRDLFSL